MTPAALKTAPQRNFVSVQETHDTLVSYINVKWHITPLNWMTNSKICSCYKGKDCKAIGKHPRYKGWQNPDSPCHIGSLEQLEKMFKGSKFANWGLVTGESSGVFAVDVDNKKHPESGKTGFDTLAELEAQYGKLPPTLTATTGGGGKHILFKYPTDGTRIRNDNAANLLGHGIDLRSDRQQIAVYPSRHKSGKLYRWDSDVSTTTIAEAPDWLIKLVADHEEPVAPLTPEQIEEFKRQHAELRESGTGARRYVEVAMDNEANKVLNAGEGQRNGTLNKAAYSLGRFIPTGLLTESEVYQRLAEAAAAIGLDSHEANATIRSGIAGGMRKPKTVPQRDYWPSDKEEPEIYVSDSVLAKFKEECARIRSNPKLLEEELQKNFESDMAHIAACRRSAEERRAERERIDTILWSMTYCNVPLHRCDKCPPGRVSRPCESCAKRLGVTRPRPAGNPCDRGGSFMVRSKKVRTRVSSFRTKCCMWGCPKCGYDNEVDHLIHLQAISEWMKDILDKPKLCIPSKNIQSASVREVNIQHGAWKVIVPDSLRRQYSTKLSKLRVYFICDYIGNDNYTFFCFLPIGFNPERLNYQPKAADHHAPLEAECITFEKFQFEHRLHVSNAGRYVKLSKTAWELCDMPEGSRQRHVAVSYCRALGMPKRMISNNENEYVGKIVLTDEEMEAAAAEYGATTQSKNTRDIDLSHARGMTMCLTKYRWFVFHKNTPDDVIKAFIARAKGKDRVAEPAEPPPAAAKTGSNYLSHHLIT